MKIQKSIISAILLSLSVTTITCSKKEISTGKIIVKTPDGRDSVVHKDDCPTCGKG
jgi:hypothetical protein